MTHSCESSRARARLLSGTLPIHPPSCGHTQDVKDRVKNNNNNNTIWGGSVLTGEELPPPLWGVEACSHPSRRHNPIPAIPPYVVSTPHLHGAPTTEESVKL